MFFKSIFLCIWFREWFLIKNLYEYLRNYNNRNTQCILNTQIYWKLWCSGGSIFIPDFINKFSFLCVPFSLRNQIGIIIPTELKNLEDDKLEDKLLTYIQRYGNKFSTNPHIQIYFQTDKEILDEQLIQHLKNEYPSINILSYNQPIIISNQINKSNFLIINQETLSFIVSFLYYDIIYRLVKYNLSNYTLLIDDEIVNSFNQRMENKFANPQEKERWQQWKNIFTIIKKNDYLDIPKYVELDGINRSCPRELWIINPTIHYRWNFLIWKSGNKQAKYLSWLFDSNIIIDYIFISDKGLIKWSKGEKEIYLSSNIFRKFWIKLSFNIKALYFVWKYSQRGCGEYF